MWCSPTSSPAKPPTPPEKSDKTACERAFINAAHKFQATAQSRNANRVSNFHSYYNRKILHGGQYDCEVGTFHARVVMRGDIAR